MKHWRLILLFVVAIAVNNIVMFKWMNGSINKSRVEPVTTNPSEAKEELNEQTGEQVSLEQAALSEEIASDIQPSFDQDEETEFVSMLRRVAETDEFIDILNEWQAGAGRRYTELEKRYQQMSAAELLSVVQNSASKSEKRAALQMLMQGKVRSLEVYELKTLYQDAGIEVWNKQKILTTLLEKGDTDSLNWAKQLISENSQRQYYGDDLLTSVYEQDPNFIKEYIDEIDISDNQTAMSLISFLHNHRELASDFYSKNFDEIIAAENNDIYRVGGHNVKFEMNDSQQRKVIELFDSGNRYKRNFAISLAKNINDTDVLRDTYHNLRNAQERMSLIYTLYNNAGDEAQLALVQELAAESEDPRIRRLIPKN